MSTKTAKHAAPKVTLRVNPSGGIGVRPGAAKPAPAPARAAGPRPPRPARGSDSRLLAGTVAGILLATGVLTLAGGGDGADAGEPALTVEEAADSVLRVTRTGCTSNGAEAPASGRHGHVGSAVGGSGFVIAPDYVMTAAHVVETDATPDVDGHSALVVAYSGGKDLAVLHVPGLGGRPLEFADDAGETVTIAGYGGSPFLREVAVKGHSGSDVITDGPGVVHGDSGGPILTADGRVAGVTQAIRRGSRDGEHADAGTAAGFAHDAIGRTAPAEVPGCGGDGFSLGGLLGGVGDMLRGIFT